MEIPARVKYIMAQINNMGYQSYIVGGAVRDSLLGYVPKDYDIFTNASREDMLSLFPNALIVGGSDRQEKMFTLLIGDVEVSQFRGNGARTTVGSTLKEHCETCDFTINAIACDINGKFYDYHNGIQHLKSKTLKFVGKPEDRIREDPLRILRAIRFICKFNMMPSNKKFKKLIGAQIHMLSNVPPERIHSELFEIYKYPYALRVMYLMGVIQAILPQIQNLDELDGGKFHDESVLDHTIFATEEMYNYTDDVRLLLAMTFHDIGKGVMMPYDGKECFCGHEVDSDLIANEFMKKYKFSTSDIKFISFLVKNHMIFHNEEISNKRATKLFAEMERCGACLYDCILMEYCDSKGNTAKHVAKFGDYIQNSPVFKKYMELKTENIPFTVKDLAVNGKDLIELGFPKSPEIGAKLIEIHDLVVSGLLKNNKPDIMYHLRNE